MHARARYDGGIFGDDRSGEEGIDTVNFATSLDYYGVYVM
jgi:hypothetical protein